MTREHQLKTWPEPFQAILDGRKKFEARNDDYGFAVGDHLLLKEWEPNGDSCNASALGFYTGREARVRVTYVLSGRFGVRNDMVIMSIDPVYVALEPTPTASKVPE